MPTYEYGCPNGHHFEKVQKITEKPRVKCHACGAPATRKISGGAGLVFKGSGFYITDYGKDGKGPRKESSDTPTAESPAKGEAKPADAKPAAKETAPAKKAAE